MPLCRCTQDAWSLTGVQLLPWFACALENRYPCINTVAIAMPPRLLKSIPLGTVALRVHFKSQSTP